MAPSVLNAVGSGTTGFVSSFNYTLPTGMQVGDYVVVAVTTNDQSTPVEVLTAPAGWTPFADTQRLAFYATRAWYRKVDQAWLDTNPTTVNVASVGFRTNGGVTFIVRGSGGINVQAVRAATGNANTHFAPAIATSKDDCLVTVMAGFQANNTPRTRDARLTEHAAQVGTGTSGRHEAVASFLQAATGDTGTMQYSVPAFSTYGHWTVAWEPAGTAIVDTMETDFEVEVELTGVLRRGGISGAGGSVIPRDAAGASVTWEGR